MGRMRRFLLLEERRQGGEPDAPPPAPRPGDRFDRVEAPPAAPEASAAASPDAALADRFAPPPEPATLLELDTHERRPVTRCLECGVDGGQFATRCADCGASLTTAAVRRLNARLWAIERAERDAARAATAARAEAELAELSAAEQARKAAVVDEAFARIMAEERARAGRTWLDAAGDVLARGPAAAWTPIGRKVAVVGAVLGLVALLMLVPGTLAVLVQIALLLALAIAALPPARR